MTTHLEKILASTRRDLALRKQSADLRRLEKQAAAHVPRGFAAALRRPAHAAPAIIAELKKASPSRGLIRQNFQPVPLAQSLAAAGAAALSVLTEENFFEGSLAYLQQVSAAVTVPLLRKDFIVDEFQMLEARAHGADAVLLIVAALSDQELKSLLHAAHSQGLDVLCEVHDAEEAARIQHLGCDAVGVNNRDLKTFEVRLETSLDLLTKLPAGIARVSESGIHTSADIARLRAAGYDACLVGESLMRQPDPGAALAALIDPVALASAAVASPVSA